jgi:RNA polymerase sigma factor (sigma-70 family)
MFAETCTLSNIQTPTPVIDLIRRATEGDTKAMRQLVTLLTPVIRASVSAVLSRSGSSRRAGMQEVEDATQTVLLALFSDRGRVLLQWDPARGLAIESFVALLAKNETISVLRSPRRNPWTEDPTLNEVLDRNAVPRMGPESETISRDMLQALTLAVRDQLSARGVEIFDMMFVRGLPADEVAAATGLTPDAVYAWKSRITRQVRDILADLASGPPSGVPLELYPPRDPTPPLGLNGLPPGARPRTRRQDPVTDPGLGPPASAAPVSGQASAAPRESTAPSEPGPGPRRRRGAAS